jgi:hypothetical protein
MRSSSVLALSVHLLLFVVFGDITVELNEMATPAASFSRAEVSLMPASLRSSHAQRDATKVTKYAHYLPAQNSRHRLDIANSFSQSPLGIYNFFSRPVEMFWLDGSPRGLYAGSINSGKLETKPNFPGETCYFCFSSQVSSQPPLATVPCQQVATFTVAADDFLLVLGPDPDDAITRNLQSYKDALEAQRYRKQYFARTRRPWIAHFPPVSQSLPFWPADFVGQAHQLLSHVGYFTADNNQASAPVSLEIKVISTAPRVLLIENLLSPFEVRHIIELGRRVLSPRPSVVGASDRATVSSYRTSSTGWLARDASEVLNRVYARLADALRFPGTVMTHFGSPRQLCVIIRAYAIR